MTVGASADLAESSGDALDVHRRYLWTVCYRMMGSAADADELVQEAFVRALERPPDDTSRSLRPWLTRVAVNLCRDALRRRRRQAYAGPWLPSPVELDESLARDASNPGQASDNPEARYDTMESLSLAFLVALEALTPAQRAVLLLRDVLDYSVRETASALEMSEVNVKVTLHRVRQKMKTYDDHRRPTHSDRKRRVERVLGELLGLLAAGDFHALEAMLAADVRSLSDGGGVAPAAMKPVTGRDRVLRLTTGLAKKMSPQVRFEVRTVNGLPALLVDDPGSRRGVMDRSVIYIELDHEDRIRGLHAVRAPDKIDRISPIGE